MSSLAEGIVLKNEELGEKYFCLTVLTPEQVAKAKPGQFMQIKAGHNLDPFLRRPISIHRFNREMGTMELLIEKKGKGTQWLSKQKTGDKLDLLGPLGQGFNLQRGETLIVGGGIGVAPLLALAEGLAAGGKKPITLLGANSGRDILKLNSFFETSERIQIATVDGSIGKQGLVTDLLERELAAGFKGFIYTCGPQPMIDAVTKLAGKYNLKGEASLETNMACGFGACLGCNCRVNGEEEENYAHVCIDGPVFPLEVLLSYDQS